MKVKIEDDVYEIVKRIKDIDNGYYVLFDTDKSVYEVHNKKQESSYCLTVPFEQLDKRLIDLLEYSYIDNYDTIINDIDKNNDVIEQNNSKELKDRTGFILKEIYDFSNSSSKMLSNNTFNSKWR